MDAAPDAPRPLPVPLDAALRVAIAWGVASLLALFVAVSGAADLGFTAVLAGAVALPSVPLRGVGEAGGVVRLLAALGCVALAAGSVRVVRPTMRAAPWLVVVGAAWFGVAWWAAVASLG